MTNISTTDDGVKPVTLQYWEPAADLRYYFGSIYVFQSRLPKYSDMTRADMPQLRFMLAGGGDYEFHDGSIMPTPEICMLGPTMGATRFALESEALVFGVSVLPLGWLAMGCESAHQWVDQLYDTEEKHGPQFSEALAQLKAVAPESIDHAVENLWVFLKGQLQPVQSSTIDLIAQIDAWLSDSESPKIEEIVEATGLSARQLARYTNKLYGAPPKMLARKYRALRCASQIVIDKKNWTELCDDGNFYDQSHFIREIKQFLGLTPHQLLNDPTLVARLTVQRRALTGITKINRIS